MREAVYNCEWYSAPLQFQKLVLNMLIRTTEEVQFEAYPFFLFNIELLAKVED